MISSAKTHRRGKGDADTNSNLLLNEQVGKEVLHDKHSDNKNAGGNRV